MQLLLTFTTKGFLIRNLHILIYQFQLLFFALRDVSRNKPIFNLVCSLSSGISSTSKVYTWNPVTSFPSTVVAIHTVFLKDNFYTKISIESPEKYKFFKSMFFYRLLNMYLKLLKISLVNLWIFLHKKYLWERQYGLLRLYIIALVSV